MSDTPRTDKEAVESWRHRGHSESVVGKHFAQFLEKELNATTAELERTKEQLRVARELLKAFEHLAQSNTDKEEPNVPLE